MRRIERWFQMAGSLSRVFAGGRGTVKSTGMKEKKQHPQRAKKLLQEEVRKQRRCEKLREERRFAGRGRRD